MSYCECGASAAALKNWRCTLELWIASAMFFLIWFVLAVFLRKGGMVHILLMTAIAIFVVQFAAQRKARHHRRASGLD